MTISNLSERLLTARKRAGIKQAELAERLNIAYSTYNKYEKGHRIPDSILLGQIAKLLDCDPGWLLIGEGKSEHPNTVRQDHRASLTQEKVSEFVSIPQVRGEISAGGGLLADNTIEMRIAFRRDWIVRKGDPAAMSLIRVRGDSMEPTILHGDIVLIDHNRKHVDAGSGIYAIAFDHEIMIKRVQLMPSGLIRIISDNSLYQPLDATPEQLTINGKVIWFGREIER